MSRGKRLCLVLDGERVYSGRQLAKTLRVRDRFWPGAALMSEDGTPVALVTLDGPVDGPVDGVFLWVVRRCPFCGKRHVHGGGPGDSDPRQRLGYRVAHCVEGGGLGCVYDLVEEVGDEGR